jgi:hypothetical protein
MLRRVKLFFEGEGPIQSIFTPPSAFMGSAWPGQQAFTKVVIQTCRLTKRSRIVVTTKTR